MARFINYTLQDAQAAPESTTVVGDIELWAQQYLETGAHLADWRDRMEVMLHRWDSGERTADGMLSSVPPADVA
jgi:hypothetical protein